MRWMLGIACLWTSVAIADWPQWMGPNRDGVWDESGLIDTFPDGQAEIDWSIACGLGYAGPAYADDSVFLFDYVLNDGTVDNNPGRRGTLQGKERLRRISGATGDVVWEEDYDCSYSVSYPSGPRATPTIFGDSVYTLGAMGHLTCFAKSTGKKVWQVDIPKEFGASVPIWGFASHPLVYEDSGTGKTLVATMIGGNEQAIGAFDAANGRLVWKGRTSKDAGYAPVNIISVGGTSQLVMFSPNEVAGLDPLTGDAFWTFDIQPDYGMSINSPRLVDDQLLVTSYGQTGALTLSTNGTKATVTWKDPGPRSLFTANSRPFAHGDLVFGCDINSGLLRAISLKDGSPVWETKEPVAPAGHTGRWRTRHATAFITAIPAEDRFVLFNDLGELVFCKVTADGYTESGRAKVVEPTGEAFGRQVVWSHPAYADRAAFVRNDEQLVRVNLATQR